MPDEVLFTILTKLGFHVRVTHVTWQLIITVKHPVMRGNEAAVQSILQRPEEVRVSRKDPNVFLFYGLTRPGRWLCAVTKRLNGHGFLITAYPTDSIKEGLRIWPV